MTQKEAVQAMLRGERVDRIVDGWAPFQVVFDDLLMHTSPARPGVTVVDAWGVTMDWSDTNQPGSMPLGDEEHLVCPDITEWRSYIKEPDVRGMELDWGSGFGQKAAAEAAGKFAMGFMPVGVFELFHNILGFEEALVSLLAEPDDAHELIDAIFDYKMACVERLAAGWHPDGIVFHDDWGSKDNLLMPPDVWRDYFKQGYKKLFDLVHANGMFVMHHSDSRNDLIVRDMEEIGIDIWQGVLPQSDILQMQKDCRTNMLFMGGLDSAVIDHKDIDPEIVRKEVFRACDAYLPGGKFIPSVTYGMAGAIFEGVDAAVTSAIDELNAKRA